MNKKGYKFCRVVRTLFHVPSPWMTWTAGEELEDELGCNSLASQLTGCFFHFMRFTFLSLYVQPCGEKKSSIWRRGEKTTTIKHPVQSYRRLGERFNGTWAEMLSYTLPHISPLCPSTDKIVTQDSIKSLYYLSPSRSLFLDLFYDVAATNMSTIWIV